MVGWIVTSEDRGVTSPFQVPLLAFLFRTPPDGLPILEDWSSTAHSIWGLGYEAWREPLELKPTRPDMLGCPMQFASVEATKGLGRLGVLLFSVTYTFVSFPTSLSDEELTDFQRLGTRVATKAKRY